uniref:High mobility group nucleosome binding domain 1 n=1 Tax=Bos indicus x Bos taurus TaxID=30522 RepID=A0A4W2GRH5_BOBOX
VPQRKISSASGVGEVPKRKAGRLSTKSTPVKMETKPKKVAGKDKSSDRKVQTKGGKGAMGKQVEMANQETEDLLASNGENGNECPASDGAGKEISYV